MQLSAGEHQHSWQERVAAAVLLLAALAFLLTAGCCNPCAGPCYSSCEPVSAGSVSPEQCVGYPGPIAYGCNPISWVKPAPINGNSCNWYCEP